MLIGVIAADKNARKVQDKFADWLKTQERAGHELWKSWETCAPGGDPLAYKRYGLSAQLFVVFLSVELVADDWFYDEVLPVLKRSSYAVVVPISFGNYEHLGLSLFREDPPESERDWFAISHRLYEVVPVAGSASGADTDLVQLARQVQRKVQDERNEINAARINAEVVRICANVRPALEREARHAKQGQRQLCVLVYELSSGDLTPTANKGHDHSHFFNLLRGGSHQVTDLLQGKGLAIWQKLQAEGRKLRFVSVPQEDWRMGMRAGIEAYIEL